MVITNVNQVVYRGDGVTTAFPFTFRIIDATDIKLLLIDADGTETDIQSDYFVDTVNNTVHYPGYAPGAEPPEADQPAPVQTGQKLVIYRELPITQEKNLGDKWPFFVIELGLDKLTLILQQIYGWWGRTLKFGVGWQIDHPDFDTTIPVEAGKTWRVNDEGTGFVATGDPDEAVVVANNAVVVANNAKDIAAGAKTTAEGIAATAQDAKDIAQDAKDIAQNAKALADDAKDVAAGAKTTAEGIAATAQEAKDIAQDAKDEAAGAKTTAESIAATAQEAKDIAEDASKSGLPVGFEAFTTNPTLQAGWLPLLGGEYSRTTYADLWAWVQTQQGYLIEESAWQAKAAANGGNVPFYSKGDGSTTFRVPALKCWVRGANSISEVGGYLASDTVQPESIVGMWVVKAYGTVTNAGSTDVANISTGLTQAETRISALENHGAAAVGSIQAFAGNSLPTGWLLCDGSAVSRTDYAALFAVIGTTYGAGDGSTTFNLPNLTDKFIQGSATAGTVKSAGLPNITGSILSRSTNYNAGNIIWPINGAFYGEESSTETGDAVEQVGPFVKQRYINFSASRSNSIYGNSSTVQPPALTMRYIIKY